MHVINNCQKLYDTHWRTKLTAPETISRSRDILEGVKFKTDYVTWPLPFQGRFLIYSWDLLCLTYTKFEVSTTTCNEDGKGNAKCEILVLSHPLGDLGATYMVHLWLIGKRVVDFVLVLIELLSLAITVEAQWADIGRNRCFERGDHCQRKFQEERGDQVADLSNENFKSSRVMRWWFSRLSSRFGAKSSRERKPKWLPGLEHSEREKKLTLCAEFRYLLTLNEALCTAFSARWVSQ